jgi:transcriptional regulator with XRE-family HTH domain
MKPRKGRPPGPTEGAADAVKAIIDLRNRLKISERRLAHQVGLHQTTVNRLLNAKKPVWTPALSALSDYVKSRQTERPVRTRDENRLSRAAVELWDGTQADADNLLRVFRSLRDLKTKTR